MANDKVHLDLDASENVTRAVNEAVSSLQEISATVGEVSSQMGVGEEASEEFRDELNNIKSEANSATQALMGASGAAGSTSAATETARESTDELGDEMSELRTKALGASGALGVLNTAAFTGGLASGNLSGSVSEAVDEVGDFSKTAGRTSVKATDMADAFDEVVGSFRQVELLEGGNVEVDADKALSELSLKEVSEKLSDKSDDLKFRYKGGMAVDGGDLVSGVDRGVFNKMKRRMNELMRDKLDISADLPKQMFPESVDVVDDVDLNFRGLKRMLGEQMGKMGNLVKADLPEIFRAFDEAAKEVEGEFAPDVLDFAEMSEKVDADMRQLSKRVRNTQMADVPLHVDSSNIKPESEEAEAIAEETVGSIELAAGLDEERVRQDVQTTKQELSLAGKPIELNLDIPEGEKLEILAELQTIIEAFEEVSDVNIDIDINASEETLEVLQLAGALSTLQAQALASMGSARGAASSIDKLGDEAGEAAADMGVMASMMNLASLNTTALSINLGAFNIALSNLVTQIPILVGLLGTLATAIMGLVGVLVLAVAGIGAFIGAGLFAELTRLEETFEGVESKAEAMQVMMKALIDQFERAIAPLTEMSEAGDIFFATINNILGVINVFSKAIASAMQFSQKQIQQFIGTGREIGIIGQEMSDSDAAEQIMSLGEFMDEVGDIFSENSSDIIAAFKTMSAFLLPVLADIIRFFVEGFDDMILFTTRFTKELSALGPVFGEFIDFAVQIVEVASTVLQGLLPVLVGLLSIGTEIASMLGQLNPELIRNAAAVGLMAATVSKARGAYIRFAKTIGGVVAGTKLMNMAMVQSTLVMNVLTGKIPATVARQAALQSMTFSLASAYGTFTSAIKSNIIFQKLQSAAIGTTVSSLTTYIASSRVASFWTTIMAAKTYALGLAAEVLRGSMTLTDAATRAYTLTSMKLSSVLKGNIVSQKLLAAATFVTESRMWSMVASSRAVAAAQSLAAQKTALMQIASLVLAGNISLLEGVKRAYLLTTIAVLQTMSTEAVRAGVLGTAYSMLSGAVTSASMAVLRYTGMLKLASFAQSILNAGIAATNSSMGPLVMAYNFGTAAIRKFTTALLQATIGKARSAVQSVRNAIANRVEASSYATLTGAIWGSVTALGSAALAKLQYVGASIKSIGATLADAASKFLMTAATQGLAAATWGAVVGLWAYVSGAIASAAATLGLTGAYLSLSAATGGLLTAIPALVVGLVALVGAGGVLVGVLANLSGITDGLKSAFGILKMMVMSILDVLIGSFISAWNSIMTAFEGVMMVVNSLRDGFSQIAGMLGLAGSEGSMLKSIWDGLIAAFNLIMVPIDLIIDALGILGFIFGGILSIAIDALVSSVGLFINALKATIGVAKSLVNEFLSMIGVGGTVGGMFNTVKEGIIGLIDWIKALPDAMRSAMGMVVQFIEDALNSAIDLINDLVNKIPDTLQDKLGISEIDDIDITGPGGTGNIDRGDLAQEDSEDADDEVPGEKPTEFNYNETTNNNMNQEINADPEEKESLSRVVKDAMEEANAFTRRTQGG